MTKRLEGTVALGDRREQRHRRGHGRVLAEEGATVALVARRRDRLEALAERDRGSGRTALVIEADITDWSQAQRGRATAVAELGRLDTLVNNAGVMLLGPIVDAPIEEWQRMVNLNVLGLLYCTHAALPHLLSAAEDEPASVADVVNISSVAGRVARLGSGVYNATKHGVGAFSESLRQEVTRRHVRVSLIEPGATATELACHNRPEILEGMAQQFAGIEIDAGRGHRREHPLHRHAAAARGGQRDPDPADRAGALIGVRSAAMTKEG